MGNNYELQTIRSACAVNNADVLEKSRSTQTFERRKVQVLLFSATLPAVLESAVAQWVTDPVRVNCRTTTAACGKEEEPTAARCTKHTLPPSPLDSAVRANEGGAINGDGSRLSDGDANRPVDDASAVVTESGQGLVEVQEHKGAALTVAASVTQVVHVCGTYTPSKTRALRRLASSNSHLGSAMWPACLHDLLLCLRPARASVYVCTISGP
jgi:hypothetical protein